MVDSKNYVLLVRKPPANPIVGFEPSLVRCFEHNSYYSPIRFHRTDLQVDISVNLSVNQIPPSHYLYLERDLNPHVFRHQFLRLTRTANFATKVFFQITNYLSKQSNYFHQLLHEYILQNICFYQQVVTQHHLIYVLVLLTYMFLDHRHLICTFLLRIKFYGNILFVLFFTQRT